MKMKKITILNKYLHFVNVIFSNFTAEFLKHSNITNYSINLVKGQQSNYKLVFGPKLREPEILKIYIKLILLINLPVFLSFLSMHFFCLFTKKL